MNDKNKNSSSKDSIREIGPYFDLGMRFAISIVIFAALGFWIDKTLNTIPVFLMAGFLLGAIAGFWTIYKAVYLNDKTNNKRD
ncbi:AtpZ/AtpI family protein [candidate division KSB1 bacterium]|nr:AtpZ/AtpI family protein [candidate division KSB1 bacterium]